MSWFVFGSPLSPYTGPTKHGPAQTVRKARTWTAPAAPDKHDWVAAQEGPTRRPIRGRRGPDRHSGRGGIHCAWAVTWQCWASQKRCVRRPRGDRPRSLPPLHRQNSPLPLHASSKQCSSSATAQHTEQASQQVTVGQEPFRSWSLREEEAAATEATADRQLIHLQRQAGSERAEWAPGG